MKIVHIRKYSGPYFPAFALNMEMYFLSLRTQSECGKIRTRITSNTDTFYAVSVSCLFSLTFNVRDIWDIVNFPQFYQKFLTIFLEPRLLTSKYPNCNPVLARICCSKQIFSRNKSVWGDSLSSVKSNSKDFTFSLHRHTFTKRTRIRTQTFRTSGAWTFRRSGSVLIYLMVLISNMTIDFFESQSKTTHVI